MTTRLLPGASLPPFDHFNLGARNDDDPANVAANRAALVSLLGLPSPPRWLQQVHGNVVHDASTLDASAVEPVADAVYARGSGLVCAVLTADCLPLLVASDDGGEVAAIHAGWRGLAAGVIEAALSRFEAPPSRLRVWLGPAIGAQSYEVGDEVRDAFLAHDPAAAVAFVATRPGHWLCDLYALARRRLLASGVGEVAGGDFDTLTDDRFYSHRRGRPTGRFATLVWIEPAPASSSQLFPRLLGDAFASLPASVRKLHLNDGRRMYRGFATIRRGTSLLSRLCGWATGLPPTMTNEPLTVDIYARRDGETWTRRFGRWPTTSRLWGCAGLLSERIGLVTFRFALANEDGMLTWRVCAVRALGVPLPVSWFAGVYAREFEECGRYRFEVAASVPLAGEIVHYTGWLDVG